MSETLQQPECPCVCVPGVNLGCIPLSEGSLSFPGSRVPALTTNRDIQLTIRPSPFVCKLSAATQTPAPPLPTPLRRAALRAALLALLSGHTLPHHFTCRCLRSTSPFTSSTVYIYIYIYFFFTTFPLGGRSGGWFPPSPVSLLP